MTADYAKNEKNFVTRNDYWFSLVSELSKNKLKKTQKTRDNPCELNTEAGKSLGRKYSRGPSMKLRESWMCRSK